MQDISFVHSEQIMPTGSGNLVYPKRWAAVCDSLLRVWLERRKQLSLEIKNRRQILKESKIHFPLNRHQEYNYNINFMVCIPSIGVFLIEIICYLSRKRLEICKHSNHKVNQLET